jgi:hypothetical protein
MLFRMGPPQDCTAGGDGRSDGNHEFQPTGTWMIAGEDYQGSMIGADELKKQDCRFSGSLLW